MNHIAQAIATAGGAGVRPVWIEGGSSVETGAGWLGLLLVLSAVVLVASAGLVWRYGSWLDRSHARDLAFRALARRLGLRGEERELLRRLGEKRGGPHPVAALISESAFRSLQRTAEPSLSLEDSRRLADVAERVFGGRG